MEYALAALTFGLVAGLKPGPLGVFVIHETMVKGYRKGFAASLAPFLTDGPIILLAILVSLYGKNFNWFIALISLLGSFYLAYLAYKIFNAPKGINPNSGSNSGGVGTAVKINLLNPSPYLFWLTIGSSYILLGSNYEASVFILLSLLSLCLTKFSVAVFFKALGQKFNPKYYSLLLRSLSFPLVLFSAQLLYSAIQLLSGAQLL